MLSFKAIITEQDIENYTRSLILPSYMAYLTMDPFHFSDQAYNANGREPLIVSYSGEGRLEEVSLDPCDHALSILFEAQLGIDPSKIVLPADAVWNWSGCSEMKDREGSMNLFFLSRNRFLEYESKMIFSAREAYISVSRHELFLSQSIIKEYLMERIRVIMLPDSPYMNLLSQKGMEELNSDSQSFSMSTAPDGFRFSLGKIEGSFTIDSPEIFKDLLLFAHLERAYGMIEEYIQFDWKKALPRLFDNGLYFYPKESKEKTMDQ